MVKVPRFNNLYGLKKLLALDLDGKLGIRSHNQDRVVVITGNEGKGKSNLALGIFETWYKDLLKVTDYSEEYIKFFGANKVEFITALATAPRYSMIVHDESLKDLYSRDSISDFNKSLNKAYYVVRGRNLFTVFVAPSILDLDSNFRKRRVSGVMHVYSAGKVAYYGRKKLNKLIPALANMQKYNARPEVKNAMDDRMKLIKPDFTDTFPLYKGVLLEKYLARKENNMEATVQELMNKFGKEEDEETQKGKKGATTVEDLYFDQVKGYVEQGMSKSQMQKETGLGYRALHKIVLAVKKDERYNRTISANLE